MDIEKLIEQLKNLEACAYGYHINGEVLGMDCSDFEQLMVDAAEEISKISTLQTENEKLRAELGYEKEHADAYYEECGQWETENAQLKAKLEAFQRERDSIEQDFRAFTKQWWEQDSGFPCRWCKFENSGGCEWKAKYPGEICAGRAFEWRGQGED